jgi:phosphatidylserine/phosphatidylglycerophosphate/cardiolipin synthase-like enzyme
LIKAYFENIEDVIVAEMDKHTHVLCATGWLTSRRIVARLFEKESTVIVGNPCTLMSSARHIDMGDKNMMHHKFMVLGDKGGWRALINGSYNFTESAKGNEENIMVIECQTMALQFAERFKEILSEGYKPTRVIIEDQWYSCLFGVGRNGERQIIIDGYVANEDRDAWIVDPNTGAEGQIIVSGRWTRGSLPLDYRVVRPSYCNFKLSRHHIGPESNRDKGQE